MEHHNTCTQYHDWCQTFSWSVLLWSHFHGSMYLLSEVSLFYHSPSTLIINQGGTVTSPIFLHNYFKAKRGLISKCFPNDTSVTYPPSFPKRKPIVVFSMRGHSLCEVTKLIKEPFCLPCHCISQFYVLLSGLPQPPMFQRKQSKLKVSAFRLS